MSRYLSDDYADLQYMYPGDTSPSSNTTNTTNVNGNVKQLYLLKQQNRSLKTMLSIGGYTYSPNYVSVLANTSLRSVLASTAVQKMYDLGFDGLNIDYEYVTSTTQATQLVSLLSSVRTEMDSYATKAGQDGFLLSFATSAGPLKYTLLDIPGMDQYLDFWDFMGFDYAGAWDTISGHSANLYPSTNNTASTPFNTTTAIQYYIDAGIEPSKINLGNPLYGHGFANTAGPGTPFNGTGGGSWGATDGTWDYKAMPLTNSSTVTEMSQLGASYSYDSSTDYMVSYDTPSISSQKAQWVVDKGLGGSMWWEISMDKVGQESLVKAALGSLGTLEGSENHLDYPLSEYANLRDGM